MSAAVNANSSPQTLLPEIESELSIDHSGVLYDGLQIYDYPFALVKSLKLIGLTIQIMKGLYQSLVVTYWY